MMSTVRFIPITSGPFSAALAAAGLASWLTDLHQDVTGGRLDAQVANRGHHFTVTLPAAITPDLVQPRHFAAPFYWIHTLYAAKNGGPPDNIPVIKYEDEKKHNGAYYDRLKSYQKAGMKPHQLPSDQRAEFEAMQPRAYWPVAAMVNQMGALSSYNKAVERWLACREFYPDLVAVIWTMTSGEPNALGDAQKQWEALAKQHGLDKSGLLPATQIVNPEQGKGANRPKADALTIGGQDSFWLLEYFKYAGLYQAALPRTVQGRKDRKTYVVLPSRGGIGLEWHQKIFTRFQQDFWPSSAIKMDIQAVLRYTMLMLDEWEAAQGATGRRRRVTDFVEGFAVASYKDLGSAVAIINVATLNLPDWVDWPHDQNQAYALKEVIREHQGLIGKLEEKKSEDEQILRSYRDFLSSRDPSLAAFFDFTTLYAGHVMRVMSKRQQVRRLSLDHLEVIILANDERRKELRMAQLKPILETPGFRNIAAAIRQSTVIPQYYKATGGDPLYDIRYGLADELRRNSRQNNEFLKTLSEFLQQYSQENSRILERAKGKPKRKRISVSTEDIVQLTELVDTYGASTIANMLVAFGYARDPKAPDVPTSDGDTPADDDAQADQTDDQDDQGDTNDE